MTRSRNMELKIHIDSEPHRSIDETLHEVKSIVTLIQNRIPEVPPMDVVIHFMEPYDESTDDLPF